MEKVLTQKLSGEMLYKLGHATETHEAVCYALGTRQRVRDFSNINSLKWELRHEGFKIVEADYMQMWKDWQSAGLGVILLGRGKKQNKFIHYYDMRKIAAAALEGKDVEVEVRNENQKAIIQEANTMQLERVAKSINSQLAKAVESPAIQKAIADFEKDKGEEVQPVAAPKAKPAPVAAKPKPKAPAPKAAPKELNLRQVNKPAPAPAGVNHVFISLRPGFFLDLKLPLDATPAEIELVREALSRVAPATKKVA
jgi:hypothetical protein